VGRGCGRPSEADLWAERRACGRSADLWARGREAESEAGARASSSTDGDVLSGRRSRQTQSSTLCIVYQWAASSTN
jgi:hypothetical protein